MLYRKSRVKRSSAMRSISKSNLLSGDCGSNSGSGSDGGSGEDSNVTSARVVPAVAVGRVKKTAPSKYFL